MRFSEEIDQRRETGSIGRSLPLFPSGRQTGSYDTDKIGFPRQPTCYDVINRLFPKMFGLAELLYSWNFPRAVQDCGVIFFRPIQTHHQDEIIFRRG
jgi:hypothetical protein